MRGTDRDLNENNFKWKVLYSSCRKQELKHECRGGMPACLRGEGTMGDVPKEVLFHLKNE